MQFFNNAKRLASEFLKFKKYKALPPVLAVFSGIFLITFALPFFVFLGILFILSIIYSLIEAPLAYLHNIVKSEGKEMKTGTQIVIYIISWPVLFMLYFIYAFMTVEIYIIYFITMTFGYIASLGGYKYHVVAAEEDISIEPKDNYLVVGLAFIAVHVVLLLVALISGIVIYATLYNAYQEEYFAARFMPVLYVVIELNVVFNAIYVPIAFKSKIEPPKAVMEKKEEEK